MNADFIRVAIPDDAASILSIYTPAVKETAASFELEPPNVAQMRDRISGVLKQYPWLVFQRQEEVLGYAYASAYRTRPGYQWSVEVSVYVDAGARRIGVARALYSKLFSILARQGYYNAYAVIALPNPSSIALHEAMGFSFVGILPKVGFKLGKWHDISWWQLLIQPHAQDPGIPIPFPEIV